MSESQSSCSEKTRERKKAWAGMLDLSGLMSLPPFAEVDGDALDRAILEIFERGPKCGLEPKE